MYEDYGDLYYNILGGQEPDVRSFYGERFDYRNEYELQRHIEYYEFWHRERDRSQMEFEERLERTAHESNFYNGYTENQFQNWNPVYPRNENIYNDVVTGRNREPPAANFNGPPPVFRRPSYPHNNSKRRDFHQPHRRKRSHLDDVYRDNHDDEEERGRRSKERNSGRGDPVLKPVRSEAKARVQSEKKATEGSVLLQQNANKSKKGKDNRPRDNSDTYKKGNNSSLGDKNKKNVTKNVEGDQANIASKTFEKKYDIIKQTEIDALSPDKVSDAEASISKESPSTNKKSSAQTVSQNSPNSVDSDEKKHEKQDKSTDSLNISCSNNLPDDNSPEGLKKNTNSVSALAPDNMNNDSNFHNTTEQDLCTKPNNTEAVKLASDKNIDVLETTEKEKECCQSSGEEKKSEEITISQKDKQSETAAETNTISENLLHENGIPGLSNTPPVSPQKAKLKMNMLPVPFPVIKNNLKFTASNAETISSPTKNVSETNVFPPLPPPLPKTLPPLPDSQQGLSLEVIKNGERKIDSDEETLPEEDFIKNLDTRKSYLACDLQDDLSVVDMDLDSPNSFSQSREYYTPPKKKQKIDDSLNSTGDVLMEIEQFLLDTSPAAQILGTSTVNKSQKADHSKIKNNSNKTTSSKVSHSSGTKRRCDSKFKNSDKNNESIQKKTKETKEQLKCELTKKESGVSSKVNDKNDLKNGNLGCKPKIRTERKSSDISSNNVKKNDKLPSSKAPCLDNKKSSTEKTDRKNVFSPIPNLSNYKIPKKPVSSRQAYSALNDDLIIELDTTNSSFHSQRMVYLFGEDSDDFTNFTNDKTGHNRKQEKHEKAEKVSAFSPPSTSNSDKRSGSDEKEPSGKVERRKSLEKEKACTNSHSSFPKSEVGKRRFSVDVNKLSECSNQSHCSLKKMKLDRRFSVDSNPKENKPSQDSNKSHNVNSQKSKPGRRCSADLKKKESKSVNFEVKSKSNTPISTSDTVTKSKTSNICKKKVDGEDNLKEISTIKSHSVTENTDVSTKVTPLKRVQDNKRKSSTDSNKSVELKDKKHAVSDKKSKEVNKNEKKPQTEYKNSKQKINKQVLTGAQHCFSFVSERYSSLSSSYPRLCRAYSNIVVDDCCDEAVILESAEIREFVEIKLMLANDSSDDVIEIKEDIPFIDLTEQTIDLEHTSDLEQTIDLKPEKDLEHIPVEIMQVDPEAQKEMMELLESAPTGPVNIFRSDETVDNSSEVQAISASTFLNNVGLKTENEMASAEELKESSETVKSLDNPKNVDTTSNESIQNTQNCSLNEEQINQDSCKTAETNSHTADPRFIISQEIPSTSTRITEQSLPVTNNSSESLTLEQNPSNADVSNLSTCVQNTIEKAAENAGLSNVMVPQNSPVNHTEMTSSPAAELVHQRIANQTEDGTRREPPPPYDLFLFQTMNKNLVCICHLFVKFVCRSYTMKIAEVEYIKSMRKLDKIEPLWVRNEVDYLNRIQEAKQKRLSQLLVGYLKNHLCLPLLAHGRLKVFFEYLYQAVIEQIPNVTRACMFMDLNTLMEPEKDFYVSFPIFKAIFKYVIDTCKMITRECAQQRNRNNNQLESSPSQVPIDNSQVRTCQPQSNSNQSKSNSGNHSLQISTETTNPRISTLEENRPIRGSSYKIRLPLSVPHDEIPNANLQTTASMNRIEHIQQFQLQPSTLQVQNNRGYTTGKRVSASHMQIMSDQTLPTNCLPSTMNPIQNNSRISYNVIQNPHIPVSLSQTTPAHMRYAPNNRNHMTQFSSSNLPHNPLLHPLPHMSQPQLNSVHNLASVQMSAHPAMMQNITPQNLPQYSTQNIPQYAVIQGHAGLQNTSNSNYFRQTSVANHNSHVQPTIYNNNINIQNASENCREQNSSQLQIHNNVVPNTQNYLQNAYNVSVPQKPPQRVLLNRNSLNATQNTQGYNSVRLTSPGYYTSAAVPSSCDQVLPCNRTPVREEAPTLPSSNLSQVSNIATIQSREVLQSTQSEVIHTSVAGRTPVHREPEISPLNSTQVSNKREALTSELRQTSETRPRTSTLLQTLIQHTTSSDQVVNTKSISEQVPNKEPSSALETMRSPSSISCQNSSVGNISAQMKAPNSNQMLTRSVGSSDQELQSGLENMRTPVHAPTQNSPVGDNWTSNTPSRSSREVIPRSVRSSRDSEVLSDLETMKSPVYASIQNSSIGNNWTSNTTSRSTQDAIQSSQISSRNPEVPSDFKTMKSPVCAQTQNFLVENNSTSNTPARSVWDTVPRSASSSRDPELPSDLENMKSPVYASSQNSLIGNKKTSTTLSRSNRDIIPRSVRSSHDSEVLSDLQTIKTPVYAPIQNSSDGNNWSSNTPSHSNQDTIPSSQRSSRDPEVPSDFGTMKSPVYVPISSVNNSVKNTVSHTVSDLETTILSPTPSTSTSVRLSDDQERPPTLETAKTPVYAPMIYSPQNYADFDDANGSPRASPEDTEPDLIWIENEDPKQLQIDMAIFIKKEEPSDEVVLNQEQFPEPNFELIQIDRVCICEKPADLVCVCRLVMYCSDACQQKDWKVHKNICTRTRQ